ncbi:MAG: hypothetical protein KME64_32800 [Scytonematopsis contorta HA4267-MV1]|jgi:hypothetical protein|nr:hypothetical protein [Scytonematopsis contorta HA4267-MV1]
MSDHPELVPTGDVNPQELAEVITELEEYRERLLNETMETAKKAKMMKASVMAQLEPELAKIDGILQQLREKQATS